MWWSIDEWLWNIIMARVSCVLGYSNWENPPFFSRIIQHRVSWVKHLSSWCRCGVHGNRNGQPRCLGRIMGGQPAVGAELWADSRQLKPIMGGQQAVGAVLWAVSRQSGPIMGGVAGSRDRVWADDRQGGPNYGRTACSRCLIKGGQQAVGYELSADSQQPGP